MPKSTDKKKSRKRPNTNSTNSENDENQEPKKKKVLKKPKSDGIDVSKQLSKKQKTHRSSQSRSTGKKNSEPRICGNGKPMPALAELELMYEDSDEDSDTQNPTPSTAADARPTTPENIPLKMSKDKLLSPRTLKQIASKVLAKIDTFLESSTSDALIPPPPPIIPPKKRKKPDIPYIVGCKDRPQVPWAPKTSFCVGDDKYGPEYNEPNSDDNECGSKKRCKRSSKLNISKSIFNAKSDEIAARLIELENNSPRDAGSPDSNKTVDYDYMNTLVPRPFSPLPSTSQDNETILKNEKLFNESLKCEQQFHSTLKNECNDDSHNDLEIIETPCETIEINDTLPDIKTELTREAEMSIEDDDLCMIWPANSSPILQSIHLDLPAQTLHTKDDYCVIVEPDMETNKNISDSIETIEIKDEIYGSLDLTQNYNTDICEIIDLDVDDVIAESNAVLEKYKNKSIAKVTTVVEPTCSARQNAAQKSGQNSRQEISNNNSNPPVRECSNTEENDQITSVTLLEQPTTVTQTTSGNSSYITSISDVVHNFFKPSSNNSSQTVDLTSSNASIPNQIHIASERIVDSVMSMLRFLGHSNSRTPTNSVQVGDDQSTSSNLLPTGNVRNENNTNMNMGSSTSTNNIDYMQYLTRIPPQNKVGKKSKKNTPNVPAKPNNTATIVEQPGDNTTTRSLGDCPICMDNLSMSAVASTLCGHIFCLDCIKAAFKTNGKKCPTCRKALKGVGYHQIFI